ncbi:MAG TPA: ComF family protein [Stellaceae bacterium]|nr:ComF family protein [Stellaceae bacterium]
MLSLSSALRRTGGVLLDLVLPPRCIACGDEVEGVNALCVACWRKVTFLGEPCCACCGLPFDHDLGAGALCGACIEAPPTYDRARSALRYDDGSRGLILAFKHGDRLHGAPAFGEWMRRVGAALLADADLVMPVPLHWTRLFGRRFNQAALLAHAIHRAGGPKVAPDWLIRRRRTPSQGQLGPEARQRNVRSAFALKPGRSVKGLKIVLVDDVLTTGATLEECARVLKRAGAARVDALALARSFRTAN